MPIPYYNTTPPTPSNKNNITDIAVTYGIRDFLLQKNLAPVYPMALNSSPGTVRIGEPILDTMVGTGNVTQPFGLPLETEGILRMEIAVTPNTFKNQASTANSLVSINDVNKTVGVFPNTQWPSGTQQYPTGANPQVEVFGILGKTTDAGFLKKATIKNLYLDTSKQVDAADWITLQPSDITQQVSGYLDTYGGLNLGGSPAIQASSVIGSILNGQGVGLAKGGVVTNYDVRSSLAGRVLGATGLINDTKLGMIGGQQLALALANNATFNVQQAALGALNVQDNVLSLVKNGTLAGFRPNYQITVPSGDLSKAADYTAKILGFTLPKSFLQDAGSIFLSESDSPNLERANSMILNTGKGQVTALISNVFANLNGTTSHDSPDTSHFRSGYAPGYKNNKGEKAINPNVYAFSDADGLIYNFITTGLSPIPEINFNRSKMIEEYGFTGLENAGLRGDSYTQSNINTPTFSWGSENGGLVNTIDAYQSTVHDKKTLLGKTQILFNSVGMKNIVSTKGDMTVSPSQLQTAVVGGGISKGNAVMKPTSFTEDGYYDGSKKSAEETYCRSWTTFDRYEKVSKLVRNSGLNETVPYRFQMTNSSLDQYGFAKIAPYVTDSQKVGDPKNFMFSIENLAWADNWFNLLPGEIGPGDLLTGKRGRIMWFPPYNIQFSENSSVSWEANNFIGRGESVYTYNNTERSGNLSFQIVVDHASYINSFRGDDGPDDHYVASFFAGCIDPSSKFAEKLTVSEKSSIASKDITPPQKNTITPELAPDNYNVYYPNDYADFENVLSLGSYNGYESGLSGATPSDKIDYNVYTNGFGIGSFVGGVTSKTAWNDQHNYGLNGWRNSVEVDGVTFSGISDPAYFTALSTYLETKCPHCVAKITSYASPQGNSTANNQLANARSQSMFDFLYKKLYSGKDDNYKKARIKIMKNHALSAGESSCNPDPKAPTDTFSCKVDRRTSVNFEFSNELAAADIAPAKPVEKQIQQQRISSKITNRLYNETSYFEQLTDIDNFVFDKFREKIKYFHPAFHSTTPEGLNSRLTFLNQCTRQGPTLEDQGANNLAFGRPPVCILRIGDFYNTKIIIESMAIDYEPLVWDLNPEGVGVQPMIANVNLSFKFIGGSTLMGPINKLQNALSFNYYANTHVYDPRADYIAKQNQSNNSSTTGVNSKGEIEVTALKPYSLVNGIVDINSLITKVDSPEEIIANEPVVNQSLAAEQVNGPTAPQQNTSSASQDVVSQIDLTDATSISGDEVKLTFKISGVLTDEINFNTNLSLPDGTLKPVGNGKITKTTESGIQIFSLKFNNSGLVDEKQYQIQVKLKFNGSDKTMYINFKYLAD